MQSKGFFLVLEGIDGCGKTTIAKMLSGRLKALITKEPTVGSIYGKKIHKILRHKTKAPKPLDFQKLYIKDRFAHLAKIILPALKKGKTVICQRYAMSTYAYGIAFGLSKKSLDHKFRKPDLTILLDLPAKVAMRRIAERKETPEYFEKEKSLEKIRKTYRGLMKVPELGPITLLDARPSPEKIVDKAMDVIMRSKV